MGEMEFRNTNRAPAGLDLSHFIHSQDLQDQLRTGTANKQAEIDALLAREQMHEAGALTRERENRASVEGVNAATNATNLAIHAAINDTNMNIHAKDIIPKEKIDAINRNYGVEVLPTGVDLPSTTVGNILTNWQRGQHDITLENIRAGTQKYSADKMFEAERFKQGQEDRRWAQGDERARQTQERIDEVTRRHQQQEAAGSLVSQIKGAYNTNPNKQGLNQTFDPGQALIDNPTEALALASQIGDAGGLPKGVAVAPIKPYPSPGIGNLWSETKDYQTKKATYDANVSQWKKSVAPPSTGGGLNTKVPSELAPIVPGAPAVTQPIPSAMGGFTMVGSQPTTTGPGPSAVSPPLAPSNPTVIRVAPDGRKIEYDAITKQPLRVVQ